MKKIIILISIILASPVFAGNLFFEIETVKAKSLQTAIKEFKVFEEVRAFEYGGPYLTLLKMKVREGGSVEQAIRHYIWKTWSGGHSTPEEVISSSIDKDELNQKLRSTFTESDYFEPDVPPATYNEIKEKFLTSLAAMKRFSSMNYYYLSPVSYTHLTLPTICSV